MMKVASATAHWVGRHAFSAAAASVLALGAAGGGIGYAVASQHTTAAPASSTPAAATPRATTPSPKGAAKASRGALLVQRALSMLASQTGQSIASVRSELQAGKSIDDIAGAKAPAIEAQILAQVNKLAARAVAAGKITAAQEATGLATAKTKVEALMAEPGTQLLKDAQKFLHFLNNHAATASPSPAA